MSCHTISNKDYCRHSLLWWYINIQTELIHILIIPISYFLPVFFLSLIRMTLMPFLSSRRHFSGHKVTVASSCPLFSPLPVFVTLLAVLVNIFVHRLQNYELYLAFAIAGSQECRTLPGLTVRSSILSHFGQEVSLFTPQPFLTTIPVFPSEIRKYLWYQNKCLDIQIELDIWHFIYLEIKLS